MHGGSSPGAPNGEANGNYRSGRFTKQAMTVRRELDQVIRHLQRFANEIT
jgi:hypothetical protein